MPEIDVSGNDMADDGINSDEANAKSKAEV